MYRFQLEITRNCNMNCPYCDIVDNSVNDYDVSFWKHVIDLISELGDIYYIITGGEPTTREDIIELLEYTQSKGYCELYTNASLHKNEFLNIINSVDLIKISLDGATFNQYSKTRSGEYFESVVENIKQSIKHKVVTSVQMTINESNFCYLDDVIQLLHSIGVEKIYLSPVISSSLKDEEINKILKLKNTISEYRDKYSSVIMSCNIGYQYPGYAHVPGAVCGVYVNRFYVTYDGYIVGCPLYNKKDDSIVRIDSNTKSVIKDISQSINEFKLHMKRSQCRHCSNVDLCGGWCPAARGGLLKKCKSYS